MNKLFTYAGSKAEISDWIYNIVKNELNNKQFVEVFCGSAAITLNNEIQNAWLNDLNYYVINIYKALREDYLTLFNELKIISDKLYSLNVQDASKYYYNILRIEANNKIYSIKNSAYKLAVLKLCYNGCNRFNKDNNFNSPYNKKYNKENKKSLINVFELDDFKQYSNFLTNIILTNLDYRELFKLLEPNKHFIYLDPPYLNNNNTHYYRNWTLDSLKELKEYLDKWSSNNGKFALSENNILIKDMFKNYNIYEKDYKYVFNPKNINTKKELLVTNF